MPALQLSSGQVVRRHAYSVPCLAVQAWAGCGTALQAQGKPLDHGINSSCPSTLSSERQGSAEGVPTRPLLSRACAQAVYAMPTQGDAAQGSIPLALQTLFYKVRSQIL